MAHVVDQLIQLAAVPAAPMQLQLCQSSELCKDLNQMTPKSACKAKKHLDFFFKLLNLLLQPAIGRSEGQQSGWWMNNIFSMFGHILDADSVFMGKNNSMSKLKFFKNLRMDALQL